MSQPTPAEKTPLLYSQSVKAKQPIEIQPLRYRDVLRGAETTRKAFLKDPLMMYISEADTFPFSVTRRTIMQCIIWLSGVYHKRILTIDRGTAILKYYSPGDNHNSWIVNIALKVLAFFNPAKLNLRRQEGREVGHAMTIAAFGESRAANMYEIQALATHPDAQGRGYGRALVRHILDKSDADGHDTFVLTTDAYPFYESLGFTIVKTSSMGSHDPGWADNPVITRIMFRPSKLHKV